jgi:peptidoglycan/xylan/chitin deacetylase (PgdA/CDA1 family)
MNLSEKDFNSDIIISHFKCRSHSELETLLSDFSTRFNIPLPTNVPEKYAYMSWADAEDLYKKGMNIGAHSVTHSVLSHLSDDEVSIEISKSIEVIKSKIPKPSGIFCYPIGKVSDYGVREKEILACSNMSGAVSSEPGSMRIDRAIDLFGIPRYAFPSRYSDFIQYATWIEEYKSQVRRY